MSMNPKARCGQCGMRRDAHWPRGGYPPIARGVCTGFEEVAAGWERRGSAIYTSDLGPGTAVCIAELHGLPSASEVAQRLVDEHNRIAAP